MNGEAEGKSASARINEAHKPNAVSANSAEPARDFWAVLQANSARMASGCKRFPRSAESELHNARGKPHRSPNPWQNRRPFPAKPPRSRGVRPRAKSDVNTKREQGTKDVRDRPQGQTKAVRARSSRRKEEFRAKRIDSMRFAPRTGGERGGRGVFKKRLDKKRSPTPERTSAPCSCAPGIRTPPPPAC